jgi:2-polyprenyl-3-methyl-5-hydroxy-6-metoxy-1,4-benzoquinol methylase
LICIEPGNHVPAIINLSFLIFNFSLNFSTRSYQKELLDGDNIPFEAISRNMHELDIINTWLGGHAITIQGFKSILGNKTSISVCEIGCGGGDNLLAIDRWCSKHHINVQLVGIDYNANCISIAAGRLPKGRTQLFCADYRAVDFQQHTPDIIFSSLFCHHFTNSVLVEMLNWMQQRARTGFFINDLHRHFLAFYSIKILTGLFSKSYLVRHDAPLSVRRGFTKKDWMLLLSESSVEKYRIEWKWAFRWLITAPNA